MEDWTTEIEEILEKLRVNCVNLSEYHRKRFYHFKSYGKYFRLPMIVLASINSTASVGLQPVMRQEIISGMTCIIGMLMGIIGAYELYLGIQSNMDLELKQSKEFYTLAIDIFKTLSLRKEDRGEDGKDYLNTRYSTYIKLVENSNLLVSKLKHDQLTMIPTDCAEDKSTRSGGGITPAPTPVLRQAQSEDELDDIELPMLYRVAKPKSTSSTNEVKTKEEKEIAGVEENNNIDNDDVIDLEEQKID